MNPTTFERMRRVLARVLRIDAGRIQPDTTLVGDLGAKSIDVIETILALEEEFSVDVPDCDITPEPFELRADMTVSELAELIDACR